ncbi:MAG: MlaD family protein [Desulfuromonadales bacterium]|nr:MlaD family protein [Desulfuromonadales bacterium]
MSEDNHGSRAVDQVPVARVQTGRSFSVIWVVPIVALLIGGWLAFKAVSAKGPTITITFENADGLVADKTLIKFKDVEVGKVTQIELLKDLSSVIVTAEMHKDAEDYMNENTQFWVVRARVAAGEVSGLGTLFSGAYIGCNPSLQGKQARHFRGLEKPPVLTEGMPGRHFVLEATDLGSLDVGAPVYYRGIKVGQVVEYDFDKQAETVLIRVFIHAPYHEKVFANTRFWNASGVDLTMDATGVKLDTQSLVSILLGGVAYDLRPHVQPKAQADENQMFILYPDHESSRQKTYQVKRYYLMYFDQSVRGLSPGAPVEIKGIRVGEVVNVELQFDVQTLDFRIPVLVLLEPERLHGLLAEQNAPVEVAVRAETGAERGSHTEKILAQIEGLVNKGFRAQLKTGNLLTGQLYVDLDFYPDASPAQLRMAGDYPVFPTVSAPSEEIVERVDKILVNIERVPFDRIGEDLQLAIESMSATLADIRTLSTTVNREIVPKVNASLDRLEAILADLDTTLGPDSALNYNAHQMAGELSLTLRSLRSLLEYLERDPQALLLGKDGDKK